MASITTAGRWIHLPQAGSERLVADAPLGAGMVQIAASNATFASRENGLRPLWEHPGAIDIAGGLDFTENIDSFPWDDAPGSTTALVLFAGVHRIRPYGETGTFPKVILKFLLSSDGSSTAGVILVGRATRGRPTPTDLRGYVTTMSGTPASTAITLTPTIGNVLVQNYSPVTGLVTPPNPSVDEGRYTTMAFYVGVWNGSGGKSAVSTLTLGLTEP